MKIHACIHKHTTRKYHPSAKADHKDGVEEQSHKTYSIFMHTHTLTTLENHTHQPRKISRKRRRR